ncbi:hypothetical protein METBIDRAFT_93347 [Metschnikowia bicuspidata var. bicuspidata NRRL YB-4993]|uniref:Mitochondrial presequence protease n=1 Tax=Metschnikowia bicuspidata var. bicuspidata NRRL YB-4993 TaxID=869754 RepID=A0A1A0HFB6_9ASCO|nr:hypothetical protein METBIDRAFT_93347 [Metschnikowia bicuspidata var. bicuspidata NRRL YB-4993]OBA22834.1 hypothetical protein METBIDRAFT_93347 [Metschnikowia bicuspidata var. bicuspidata NRRL YB-4993]
MSRFARQTAFDVDYAPARISKWRSPTTGLQLTYINQPSPIVNGYFAVATEIADDSGCPHTLEHLVFMGSKKYPYKGLLDSLGNRFFSSTNAWTSVDQTVYTLSTAGWEGFRTLLPVYLDHLFHPTLTDDACLTEVYHIDGKGKEKGVVFSEMQGIESQTWFVSYLNLQKTLYAERSGYSSETGGLMAELRHLTNSQIRDFHRAMYRPDNLCVVITGSVDEAELLATMSAFDEQLAPLPGTLPRRPFVDSPHDLPLPHTVVKSVQFPDDDESMAELVIGWIGPESGKLLENLAVDMVGSYLADSPISLFNRHLVEVDEPLATEIDYGTDDFVRTGLNFTVSGIPTAHLHAVDAKLKALLEEQTHPEHLDLKYMTEVVNQQKLKFVAQTERDPATFSNMAILEFIYGNPDGLDLLKWTKSLNEFEVLSTWTAEEWCALIKTYFVNNHPATILGVPSSKLNRAIKKANKDRSKEIKARYGDSGLAQLGEKLQLAQAANDKPIPDELLTQFGKPDPSKIEFIKTKSFAGGANEGQFTEYEQTGNFHDVIQKDLPENFPLYLHFQNFHSQFATIHLLMSTTSVPERLLKYFAVLEEIFSMSIQLPTGEYIPYEKVITELNNDLIEFQFDNGIENQFAELLSVKVKFEKSNYKKSIQWLTNVLKYSVFEESRIKIIIEKIVNSLADKKRNDELMMYSLQYRTVYTDASIRKAQDCINTEEFYKELLQKIKEGGFSEIKTDLEAIRAHLFNVLNMKVFVVGGATSIESPVSSWTQFVKEFESKPESSYFSLENIPRAFEFKTSIGNQCSKKAFLATTPASETTHFISLTPIPTDYLNEDIYKIALASEFLGGVEGPFWRAIRGTGLAYGANIRRLIESGYLSFSIYRGADAQQAWITGKKIISDYISGELEIDAISIENSIAAIVNELANAEANSYDAAINKITDEIFKKRGSNYVSDFLKQLNTYTSEDLIYILKKYFLPLFSSESSLIFSCVPTTKYETFSKFLHSQGYEFT